MYGVVIDVVCLKTMKMRGQAFIVFQERTQAAAALKNLQGKLFYNRPLVCLSYLLSFSFMAFHLYDYYQYIA